MNANSNSINWFEIPSADFSRAQSFYENIFEIEMQTIKMGDTDMAMFPSDPGSGKANGAVVFGPDYRPSMEGAVIYLNGDPNLDQALSRVQEAGGEVLMPKMSIGEENGFIAFFRDTEGNKVGLHSNQ